MVKYNSFFHGLLVKQFTQAHTQDTVLHGQCKYVGTGVPKEDTCHKFGKSVAINATWR